MAESKGTMIGIRVSEDEKELLTQEANKIGMSLSQYVRYKALEEYQVEENQQKTADEFLEKYLTKISRMIIDGYINIKALTHKQLTEEENDAALKISYKEFDEMGIAKWEEKYGEKTPKINKEDKKDD